MSDIHAGLLRGTLELLILKALSWGPRHGYATRIADNEATQPYSASDRLGQKVFTSAKTSSASSRSCASTVSHVG